jgi:hypothetical protein
MQNQTEIAKLTQFLQVISPIVTGVVRTFLQALDLPTTEEGSSLDMAFHIKLGEKEAKFFLRNLLLEIATIDRDEEPLRFDERLADFDFFLKKATQLTSDRLYILLRLLSENDLDKAVENICADPNQYERIRIWRFDRKPR